MIPKHLQGVLWSRKIENLSLKRDQRYIIHQILVYGSFADWSWMFKVYGAQQVKEIFLKQPLKIYPPAVFNFVKKILFGLPVNVAPSHRYDQTAIRHTG